MIIVKIMITDEGVDAIGFKTHTEIPSGDAVTRFVQEGVDTCMSRLVAERHEALAQLDEDAPIVKIGQGDYIMELRPRDLEGRHGR